MIAIESQFSDPGGLLFADGMLAIRAAAETDDSSRGGGSVGSGRTEKSSIVVYPATVSPGSDKPIITASPPVRLHINTDV